MNRIVVVRRGRASELKRRARVHLDIRRFYPANGEPARPMRRSMTLAARLKHWIGAWRGK